MFKVLAGVLLVCLLFAAGCGTRQATTRATGSTVGLDQSLVVGGGGSERATVVIRGRYGPNGEVPQFMATPLLPPQEGSR